MKISNETIVGEIVKMNYKAASLFQENNIDYCCGGRITLSEACSAAGIDSQKLITQLDSLLVQNDPEAQYIDDLNLEELCRYIVKRHHNYIRETIPFLERNLEKLCNVHGESHPELFQIKDLFNGCVNELTKHMQKEEVVLFPYVARMVLAKENQTQLLPPSFGSVTNPIRMMMNEHQNEGERFIKITELTNHYQLPEDACTTYHITYNKLKEFEDDLHRHIHLENNILFPKSALLENELLNL